MQSENLAYVWNDVALLTEQRAYTFVCKTMVQMPIQGIAQLQEILLADWQYQPDANACLQFAGSMQLQIGYISAQQQRGEVQVTIPLQGALEEPLTAQSTARLLYGKGKVAGDCLLLEAVLQIPRTQALQRNQVILGQFSMEELLELPEPWPCMQDVLVTMAAARIETWQIAQQQLQVQGQYDLAVVYENNEQPGERLFAYQQQRPLVLALPVPPGLQELSGVQPYYQNITAQLLDDRRIFLTGEGMLCTADAGEPMQQEPQPKVPEAVQPTLMQQANSQPTCEDVCPVRHGTQNSKPNGPSVVQSRGSRRANLSKYMRNLNSSVQTPKFMRNFEIGSEPQQGQ